MVSEKMDKSGLFRRPNDLSLSGNVSENWKKFIRDFDIFVDAADLSGVTAKRKANIFLNIVGPAALEVYHTFQWENAEDRLKYKKIVEKFEAYCSPQVNETYERHIFKGTVQGQDETIDHYVTELRVKASTCNFGALANSMIRDQLVSGVKSDQVRERLLRYPELTLEKAITAAKAAEVSIMQMKDLTLNINSAEGKARPQQEDIDLHVVRRKTPPRTFSERNQPRANPSSSGSGLRGERRSENFDKQCQRCGYFNHSNGKCLAESAQCRKCQRNGHFAKMCRSNARNWRKQQNFHSLTDRQYDDESEVNNDYNDSEELFFHSVSDNRTDLKQKWTVTVHINNKPVVLKIDSGSDSNCLSKEMYQSLSCKPLKNSQAKLVGYFGQSQRPSGTASMDIVYKDRSYRQVQFQVVDSHVVPVLGLKTSLELGLIKRIYTVDQSVQHNTEQRDSTRILGEYNDLFQGLGCVDLEYDIKIDPNISPVVHAPRRVPFALHDKLKAQLDKLVKQNVIVPIEEPTPWVNSLVTVEKTDGSLRICIDPRDLNRAILREHYPMKTVEEVAAKLSSASVFSILDAGQAYYQVKVSEKSSKLLTFNTPFGRYRFLRMPFGIKSAPEVWQRTASQFFGDLDGTEVIMDDILVWGRTQEEHDERLRKVLQRARDRNITLNRKKCKVGLSEVNYVGHVLSSKGLKVDDSKVIAIKQMESPKDKAAVLRFLGMIAYIGKFIPNLSQRTSPLRELTKKTVDWHWDNVHQECVDDLKKAISEAPVLAYFDPKKPVVISVDASSQGLGACVLQENQPVAYASRSLSSAEKNYGQIEKEMLAITYGCDKFHDYIYGHSSVTVETDHKPLQNLHKKPLAENPPRIQRMMLRIQKYDIQVKYRPGKELFIADTLSRSATSSAENSEDDFEVHVVD